MAQPRAPQPLVVDDLQVATLTKAQLVEQLFEQIGLNKREAGDMVDAFFDLIAARLVAGEEVKLSSFGNFQLRQKSARPGRNPRTGEEIPIEPRCVVTFRAGPKLKRRVQNPADAARD